MDGGDVATETELTAELRRAQMRGEGLPSSVSEHGREKWFAGEAEELWWWCWSG